MEHFTTLPSPDGANGRTAGPGAEPTIVQFQEDVNVRASRLGGRWDVRRATIVPSETTLNAHARAIQIAVLPIWSLVVIGCLYYPLVTALGGAYGWLVTELQAWEAPFSWLGGASLGLAFGGVSLLVMKLWQRAAIARYREDDVDAALWAARVATLAALVIDFAASYTLLNASLRESFLGVSTVPSVIVWLMASLTTLAQLLGAFYGWNLGLRHEVCTSWWSALTTKRVDDLDELRRRAFLTERQREQGRIHRRNRRPPGHVVNQ